MYDPFVLFQQNGERILIGMLDSHLTNRSQKLRINYKIYGFLLGEKSSGALQFKVAGSLMDFNNN